MLRSLSVAALLPVALAAISAPLLARLMDPTERGILGAGLATITIAAAIGLGGAQQALARGLGGRAPGRRWFDIIAVARRTSTTMTLAAIGALVWVLGAVTNDIVFAATVAMSVVFSVVGGVMRSILHAMGSHELSNYATGGESALRLALIFGAWATVSHVSPAAGLLLVITLPAIVTLLVSAPTISRIRSERSDELAHAEPLDTPRSGLLLELTQQLMGRSVLAFWALGLQPSDLGYLTVAFAPTEPTMNIARVAQPAVIETSTRSKNLVTTLIRLIIAVAVAGIVAGFLLVVPLFGADYSGALTFLVPIGIAQAGYAACVTLVGRRYAESPRQAIGLQATAGGAIIVCGLIASQQSTDATVWTYAAISLVLLGVLAKLDRTARLARRHAT